MKPLCFATTLLALAVIFSGSAPAQNQPIFDHFLCYYVPNGPFVPLPSTTTIQLKDQFDTENPNQLQIWHFCNPAVKQVGGVIYPDNVNHHLTLFQINPQPIISRQVILYNQFAPSGSTFYTSDGRVLAVPTGKALPPNPAPSPSPDLDHYKCYVASGPIANKVVTVSDQFINNQSVYVAEPVLFCNPVEKIVTTSAGTTDTPIQFPNNHLTCYEIAPLPSPFPPTVINTWNQFGRFTYTVNGPDMLCAPTTKQSWSLVTAPPATSSNTRSAPGSAALKRNKP